VCFVFIQHRLSMFYVGMLHLLSFISGSYILVIVIVCVCVCIVLFLYPMFRFYLLFMITLLSWMTGRHSEQNQFYSQNCQHHYYCTIVVVIAVVVVVAVESEMTLRHHHHHHNHLRYHNLNHLLFHR